MVCRDIVRPEQRLVLSGGCQLEREVDFGVFGIGANFLTDFERGCILRVPYFEDAAEFVFGGSRGQRPAPGLRLHEVGRQRGGESHAVGVGVGRQRVGFVLAARGHQPHEGDNPEVKMILFHVFSNLKF